MCSLSRKKKEERKRESPVMVICLIFDQDDMKAMKAADHTHRG